MQLLKQTANYSKALQLKMWQCGPNYMVYLGGLPINIVTGYTAHEQDDEAYTMPSGLEQTEICRSYSEASKLFEQWDMHYL